MPTTPSEADRHGGRRGSDASRSRGRRRRGSRSARRSRSRITVSFADARAGGRCRRRRRRRRGTEPPTGIERSPAELAREQRRDQTRRDEQDRPPPKVVTSSTTLTVSRLPGASAIVARSPAGPALDRRKKLLTFPLFTAYLARKYWFQPMRRYRPPPAGTALSPPLSRPRRRTAPGDGSLVVSNADGTIIVQVKGVIFGHFDRGKLTTSSTTSPTMPNALITVSGAKMDLKGAKATRGLLRQRRALSLPERRATRSSSRATASTSPQSARASLKVTGKTARRRRHGRGRTARGRPRCPAVASLRRLVAGRDRHDDDERDARPRPARHRAQPLVSAASRRSSSSRTRARSRPSSRSTSRTRATRSGRRRPAPRRSAQAAAHEPALIVLDLMLPDIDGIEVCKRVRQTLRRADPDADRARRGRRQDHRPRGRRRRLPDEAVQPARARRADQARSCAAPTPERRDRETEVIAHGDLARRRRPPRGARRRTRRSSSRRRSSTCSGSCSTTAASC